MYKRCFAFFIVFVLILSAIIPITVSGAGAYNVSISIFDSTDPAKTMNGARIELIGPGGTFSAILSSTGNTAAFTNVSAGEYSLLITLEGYSSPPRTMTITSNIDTRISMNPLPHFGTPASNPAPTPAPGSSPAPSPAPTPKPASTPPMAKPVSEVQNNDKADVLKSLGLFTGTDAGYNLEEPLLRIQGAVFLVKLLGEEENVKSNKYTHPFTDVPSWADSYVGYLYENRISSGIGGGEFGSMNYMTAAEYTAFVLRALGYVDRGYNLSNDLLYAWMIGLINNEEYLKYKAGGTYYRDDAVLFSYNALKTRNCSLPGDWKFFAQQLVEQGAVSKDKMVENKIFPEVVFSPGWEAPYFPFTYNMNSGGDWEVYKDLFEVVDFGKIGNAESSVSNFKLSRTNYSCGFKIGEYMSMMFNDGVPISPNTHSWAVKSDLTSEDSVRAYLVQENEPLGNFQAPIDNDTQINIFGPKDYIAICERTRDGLRSYVVLKPKYKFVFDPVTKVNY